MKGCKKKLLSALLAGLIVIGILPVQPVQAAETVGVREAMNQMLSEYPSGSFFTVNGRACAHGARTNCSNCSLIAICRAKGKSVAQGQGDAWTCVGFASYVMNQVFGTKLSGNITQIGNGKKPVNQAASYQGAKVGDLIYFYRANGKFAHIAICMGVTDSAVTLYECNTTGRTGEVSFQTIPYSQMRTYRSSFATCAIYRAKNYDLVNQTVVDCAGNHTKGTFSYSDPVHPHNNYYICSICRKTFADGTTTPSNSCSNCNSKGDGWESWSEWSTTPAYPSDTRQVETRQVEVSPARTEYRYAGYVTTDGRHDCWCETYLRNKFGSAVLRYSNWSTVQYTVNGSAWTCGQCNSSHTGVDHYGNDGRAWWAEYTLPDGKDYYWQETRTVEAQFRTEYRYRDKKETQGGDDINGNDGGKWVVVDWTSVAPSPSDRIRNLEERSIEVSPSHTEYRYVGYATTDGRHECWCETYLRSKFGSAVLRYSDWSTTRYSANGSAWSCGQCNGNHTGVDHYGKDGRAWWAEFTLPDGRDFYWEENRTIPAEYRTEYKYEKWVPN